jgi:hypothetical protein
VTTSFVLTEIMLRCSPLGETKREVATVSVAEVGNIEEVGPTGGNSGALVTSNDEGHVSSGGESGDSVEEGAFDNENLWTY